MSSVPSNPPPSQPLRLLVVEDQEDARETLKALLEMLGHSVLTARDGVEGLALALAQPPDVALIDLGIPGIDGFELGRRIRASGNRGTFLAALTGYGSTEDRERSRAAGFDAHVTKPIELPALEELLAVSAMDAPRREPS